MDDKRILHAEVRCGRKLAGPEHMYGKPECCQRAVPCRDVGGLLAQHESDVRPPPAEEARSNRPTNTAVPESQLTDFGVTTSVNVQAADAAPPGCRSAEGFASRRVEGAPPRWTRLAESPRRGVARDLRGLTRPADGPLLAVGSAGLVRLEDWAEGAPGKP